MADEVVVKSEGGDAYEEEEEEEQQQQAALITNGHVESSGGVLTPREAELETRVKQDPSDTEAWEELAESVDYKRDPSRMRSVFERMLERFPLASSQWVRYAEMEEALGEEDRVKTILRRVLNSSYSVEIWLYYLSWLRRTRLGSRDLSPLQQQTARVELREAFEEAIKSEKVGCAMDAGPIWRLYVEFLEEEPEVTPYEQGQKMDALRKLYRQAVCVPIRGLEQMWKEYQTYENGKHERTAKQLLDEVLPGYNHAAEVLKEREQFWRPLLAPKKKTFLPRKPQASSSSNNNEQWMKMLQYEKGNPEQLSPVQFKVRVRLAYRRALADLWFHSDVWFSFSDFERSVKDDEASLTILRESLRALPDSSLLHFCLADALECDGALDEARQVHESLLQRLPNTAGYIQRMRFARRIDGIASFRDVFRRARAWPGCDSAIYCCAAEIEFRMNKSFAVSRRVFDLGLKRFPKDALLAHKYLDLMHSLNDDEASRDVFERVIESFSANNASPDEVLPVWERYREFARDTARDLSLVGDAERSMQQQQHKSSSLYSVLHRYILFGAVPSLDYLQVDVDQVTSLSASSASSTLTRLVQNKKKVQQVSQQQLQVETQENQVAAAAAAAAAAAEDAAVPQFLRRLVAVLPRKLHGIVQMDVDFVMRNLIKGTLPPPPTARATGGSGDGSGGHSSAADGGPVDGGDAAGTSSSLLVRKRRSDQVLGAEGAPTDAFKQRQKRSRG